MTVAVIMSLVAALAAMVLSQLNEQIETSLDTLEALYFFAQALPENVDRLDGTSGRHRAESAPTFTANSREKSSGCAGKRFRPARREYENTPRGRLFLISFSVSPS